MDLGKHRQAVRDTLGRMDMHAVVMEQFGARGSGDPATVSTDMIADCDAYVGIVAWRYGFIPTNGTCSVTHLEYLEAMRLKKPCLIFLAEDSTEARHDLFPAQTRDPDHEPQLRAFRELLRSCLVVDHFTTPDDLASRVAAALHRELPQTRILRFNPAQPKDYSGTESGLPLPPLKARGGVGQSDEKGLVGRDAEQRWLEDHILGRTSAGVWAVQGMGGIGKTALVAVCIANLQEHFDGGVAVVVAREIVDPTAILRILVERFVKESDILLARSEVSRKVLGDALLDVLLQLREQGKLAVVVIDNVEPELADNVELKRLLDLLQTAGVSVVITSRERLPGSYVQESMQLATLAEAEAIELFARLSGRFPTGEVVGSDRAEVASICRTFQGHTLATVVAASDLEQHPSLTLVAYRERLAQPYAILGISGFEAPKGVGEVFASSHSRLVPGARQLFAALGVLAGPGCTTDAAVALGVGLGQTPAQAQTHLDRLIRGGLVSIVVSADRIERHPLVQQFTSLLFGRLSGPEAESVRAALAGHYAQWTVRQSTQELSLDASNLLASLGWAKVHTPASDVALAGLAFGLRWYWDDRFDSAQAFEWLPAGYAALRRIGHGQGLARFQAALAGSGVRGGIGLGEWRKRQSAVAFALGIQHQLNGRIDDAQLWFTRSHRVAELVMRRYGDPIPLAEARSGLAAVAQQHGRSEQARLRYEQSLKLFQDAADRKGQADAHYRLGFLALRVGNCAVAERHFTESLNLLTHGVEDERLRAVDYYSLANVAHQRGDLDHARQRYQEAYDTCVRNDNRRGQGAILKAQGDLAWQTVGPDKALEHLGKSLRIFGEIFDHQAESVAKYSIAFMHRQVGRVDEAIAYYDESLATRVKVEDKRGEGFVRKAVGDVKRRTAGCRAPSSVSGASRAAVRADMREAEKHLTTGLALSREVSDRRNTGVALKALGDWAWQGGSLRSARNYYEQSALIRTEVWDKHGAVITAKALADLAMAEERFDDSQLRLDECGRIFVELEDLRGQAAVLHSRAILAWHNGDVTAAERLLRASLESLRRVDDKQSQAVATYTMACLAEAEPFEDVERAAALYQEGIDTAELCRAVHIGAVLREGRGNLLLRRGREDENVQGRALLRQAVELYHGLERLDDARRVERRLSGAHEDRPSDRMAYAMIYDLDEGPNGQGFAIPNDRRRTSD